MRFRLVVILATILAVTAPHPAGAGKVTVDPNKTRPTTIAPPQDKPDPRLARKVTYTATDKRLHSVLEEISKQTRVIVYSGKTPADWQVRDLPVIVCVKDLPLGKLLRSIADATHLALTSTTVKDVRRYRIWRDPKREKQLADYFKKKSEVDLAHAKWEWDGLVKYAQAHGADKLQQGVETTLDLGKVLAALPSNALESVLSGKHVHLTPQNTQPPLSEYLKAISLECWQNLRQPYENNLALAGRYGRDLNDFELGTMALDVSFTRGSHSFLCCQIQGPLGFDLNRSLYSDYYDTLLEEQGNHGKKPKDPAPPRTEYAPGLVKIDLDKPGSLLPDRKLRIAAPKPSEEMTYPDVVSRISETSGFSVVLENLRGHQWRSNDVTSLPIYDRDTTLQEVLRALQQHLWRSKTDWFVDNDSDLLVGSASSDTVLVGSGREWWSLHRALASEALISNLVKKYNGDGLEIDEMAAVYLLTDDQREEWIFLNKDLFVWKPVPHTEPFWRLYAGLSPENKAVAKSSAGLPLAKLSPDAVRAAFTESSELAEAEGLEKRMEGTPDDDSDQQKHVDEWQKQHYPELGRVMLGVDPLPVDWIQMMNEIMADFPEIKAMWDIPTDTDVISKLRMRLITKEDDTQPVFDEHDKIVMQQVPEDFRTHSYTLIIEGDGVNLRIPAPLYTFPAYSQKRKKQLEEARKKDAGKAAGAPPSQPK